MDLTFTSEQEILQDSAVKFAQKGYGFEQYKKSLAAPGQSDPAIWKQIAEFGWLALPVPESAGGLGGSTLDVALVAEALGAALVVEPFLTGAFLPAAVIAAVADPSKHADLLGQLAAGDVQLAVAYTERTGRFDPAHVHTHGDRVGDGYVLNGEKLCVFNAPNASHLIVSAHVGKSIELFLVGRETAGVGLNSYPVLGGGVAADVKLHDVKLGADAHIGDLSALEIGLDKATAAACAQALGGMKALFERTAAYLRTRKQFGVPIGTFQALQHRLVDMFIEIEQSRSMVLLAAAKADGRDATERRRAVSSAKAYVGKASKMVAQQAVQLHGGIGMTEELDVGHYFRQLTAFGTRFGDRDHHLDRVQALSDAA
ncbi:MAG: pimeloyl-CoA dehydrogenase small subunit [Panacagrimonas sp.]|jgi:alkylation response protein AidB-like acyl-CoA dehydrogenase|nr:acyl-CoA dehydrogenase family protein [Panacagrimonas sp.]MCC2656658.1 pimeloyl-CoA dehydrogenase small subunit [Panacagrimonas sp.]